MDADLGGAPRIQAARRLPPQVDFGAYEAANAPPLFTTAPITTGVTTLDYVYRAVAVDPNAPDPPLAITAVQTPPWLLAEPQADGALLLHGAPGPEWYGYFDVLLRAADALGVTTDQAFTIRVMPRVYSLYLPQVMK